jgi:hypothetical protein
VKGDTRWLAKVVGIDGQRSLLRCKVRKRRSKEPGKIKVKLTEMLQAIGVSVSPYDLWVQQGVYRSIQWDCARWGGHNATYNNQRLQLTSWDTMTSCVRYGITISCRDPIYIEVYSKEP